VRPNSRGNASCALALLFLVGGLAAPRAHAEDRSYDGSANNTDQPAWGSAGSRLTRVAPPAYADGIPSARAISNGVVAQSQSIPDPRGLSGWVFQWGQFVDHDITLTPLADPPEEMDIPIPPGDPTFDPTATGTAVMAFQRSMYDPTSGMAADDPRAQVDVITSWLDGSGVYGSDAARADALRTHVGGRLAMSPGDLLPHDTAGLPVVTGGPPDLDPSDYFLAGDERVNEQPGLTCIHTLFAREHNRWADALAAAHPAWSDEQIYQRARKIVGAEIEAITFEEFLPALLGSAYATEIGPDPGYDPRVDATIATEFSSALYRVGHTMLVPALPRVGADGRPAAGGPLPLRDAFFVPDNLDTLATAQGTSGPLELELLVRGLASQVQQAVDVHVVDDVRNFLFGDPLPGGGFDLASLNIQRGRDHGLPDYATLRVFYGLPPVTSFDEIASDPVVAAQLAALYGSVDDIDPWVGAIAEDHLPGSSVGPLIAAALGEQFRRLRAGDRLWYERDPDLADQVDALRATRLADVIRRNTGIRTLPADVFFAPEPGPAASGAVALAALALSAPSWTRRRRSCPGRAEACADRWEAARASRCSAGRPRR
jgi:peroxidase